MLAADDDDDDCPTRDEDDNDAPGGGAADDATKSMGLRHRKRTAETTERDDKSNKHRNHH